MCSVTFFPWFIFTLKITSHLAIDRHFGQQQHSVFVCLLPSDSFIIKQWMRPNSLAPKRCKISLKIVSPFGTGFFTSPTERNNWRGKIDFRDDTHRTRSFFSLDVRRLTKMATKKEILYILSFGLCSTLSVAFVAVIAPFAVFMSLLLYHRRNSFYFYLKHYKIIVAYTQHRHSFFFGIMCRWISFAFNVCDDCAIGVPLHWLQRWIQLLFSLSLSPLLPFSSPLCVDGCLFAVLCAATSQKCATSSTIMKSVTFVWSIWAFFFSFVHLWRYANAPIDNANCFSLLFMFSFFSFSLEASWDRAHRFANRKILPIHNGSIKMKNDFSMRRLNLFT